MKNTLRTMNNHRNGRDRLPSAARACWLRKAVQGALGAVIAAWLPSAWAVFPNQNYPLSQLWKPTHTGYLKGVKGTGFQNQPHAHGGYVVVAGNGTHMVLDIQNPSAPMVKQVVTSPYRTEAIENQHDQEQEGHTLAFARYPDGKEYMVTIGGKGVDIWDVTNINTGITHVKSQDLPGINYGDVDGAIWGLSWQGNYLYVGATNNGLYVLDMTDPRAPKDLVSPQTPNSFSAIPTSQWNNHKVGPLFALGNLLVFGTPKGGMGMGVLDISQPGKPITLSTQNCTKKSYITWFYGKWLFCEEGIDIFDVVSNPSSISHIGQFNGPASEYMSFADDTLFLGALRPAGGVYKYDISNIAQPQSLGKVTHPSTQSTEDDQFSVAIGNLLVVTDDEHDRGAFVAVHSTEKDTKAPRVIYANPLDGDQKLPISTRFGVSLSDQIDLRSVNTQTLTLRKVSTNEVVQGYFGVQHTLVHFSPVKALSPNTAYELVLAQGGIRDLVGNGLDKEYRYRFKTAGTGSEPIRIEAENASLSNGVLKASTHGGFSGSAYVDYPDLGGEVMFELTQMAAGEYPIRWRYANGGSAERQLLLSVNGGPPQTVQFPRGTAWTNWLSITTKVTLNAGQNRLRLFGQSTPGPNLDFIELLSPERAAPTCAISHSEHALLGTVSRFTATQSPNSTYAWKINDAPEASSSSLLETSFSKVGRYHIQLSVTHQGLSSQCSVVHIVHNPISAQAPQQSGPMILDANQPRLWVVNPDNNSISAHQQDTLALLFERPVGEDPRGLAQDDQGRIWVTLFDAGSLAIVDNNTGATLHRVSLPYGSQPYGVVVSKLDRRAYVSLQALGKIAVIDTDSLATLALIDAYPNSLPKPKLRALALSADGRQLLVTRFVSSRDHAEVVVINTLSLQVDSIIPLTKDEGNGGAEPDNTFNARGVLNYLSSISLSPDGQSAWVSAKKDNVERGLALDGRTPTFDSTTRTVIAPLDMVNTRDLLQQRVDFNDSDSAVATVISRWGDLIFVALQGNNRVQVVDTASGKLLTSIATEAAPQGLSLRQDGRLFVHNFLSRSVEAFDVAGLIQSGSVNTPRIAQVSSITTEKLPATLLRGKQIFYNASRRAMSRDGYLSCATCHADGDEDGQVFDFTHRGEGMRNTISLQGRAGMGHGPVHWSGNFDEIQDFEQDIRQHFGGLGFMDDTLFNTGTRNHPLGDKKAGLSSDLDALAAYVSSLNAVPRSPYRNNNGTLTAEALAGRAVFISLNCTQCHSGPNYTDSALGLFHDVGTINALTGKRLGEFLFGLDTPTLKGLWNTAPYLHDGSASDLKTLLMTPLHGNAQGLSAHQLDQLVAFLLQLDETPTLDTDGDGVDDAFDLCANTAAGVAVDVKGCPSITPFPLQAEHYQRFFDTTAGNTGGAFRNDNVDIQATTDTGGGFNIGWTVAGEWLEYDVFLPAGTYSIKVRVANGSATTSSLRLTLGNKQVTASFGNTGGWQSWRDLSMGTLTLTEPAKLLRVDIQQGPMNLNWFDIRKN